MNATSIHLSIKLVIIISIHPSTQEEMCDSRPVFSSRSTSPDSMESVGFFTSACSSPSAVYSEAPSAQEPILLKQKNSSAVPEEEEIHVTYEDKTPADMISGCPDLTLTLEGTTEALSINSLSRESIGEIVYSWIWLFYSNDSVIWKPVSVTGRHIKFKIWIMR